MNLHNATTRNECLRTELAAYIDGELSPREELELEMHLAVCRTCASELNEQKKLLCALDFVLESERKIELPADFTKIIVTNAQSNVSGLRSRRERFNALLVCSVLLLFVILGVGGETSAIVNMFGKFIDQVLAVVVFAAHFAYDVSIGSAVILRSLGNQFVSVSHVIFVIFAALFVVSLFALSRLFVRYNRA